MRLWSKLSVMLSALLSVACSVSPPKDIKVVTLSTVSVISAPVRNRASGSSF